MFTIDKIDYVVTVRFSSEDVLRQDWAKDLAAAIRQEIDIESRNSDTRYDINSSENELPSALDAITIQPVVLPNSTPSIVEPPPFDGPLFPPDQVEAIGKALVLPNLKQNWTPTPAQQAAQDALTAVKPETLSKAANETFADITALAATLPADNPLVQAAAAVEPPKRKRKPAGITLNTPEQESTPQVAGSSTVEHSVDNREVAGPTPAPPTTPQQVAQALAATPVFQAATAMAAKANEVLNSVIAQAVQPPKVESLLTPEQKMEMTERLAKYRNEILPHGGMVPFAQVGGVEAQLRKYVAQFCPERPSSKTWTYENWVNFVGFFDNMVATVGPDGLVRHIQEKIGITK